MPVHASSKYWHACQSSARFIKVIGLVKVGSGREVVDAMARKGAQDNVEMMVRA